MGLESITIGEVVRAPRERLIPGTLIIGFTAYDEAETLPVYLAHKLHTGKGHFEFGFYSTTRKANPNKAAVLIMDEEFKGKHNFLGHALPEMALMIPADISLAPAGILSNLDKDGLAYMLRYGLYATGKGRFKAYWVVCSIFREKAKPLAWGFGRQGTREYLNKLIARSGQEYAQRLAEGREEIFGS